jgi:hypothetical protein
MYKVGTVARVKRVALGVLLMGSIIVLCSMTSFGASTVKLAWDASPDGHIAGYNVYYGNAPHSYPNEVPVGNSLATTISGLADGKTYFVSVTAVDDTGIESDFSDEITYSTPGVNQSPTISGIPTQTGLMNQTKSGISFTISDPETAASSLSLSAVSSVTSLVPNANIVFGGTGQNRTVTITPATGQTGSTLITLTVGDGTNTASSSFTLDIQQPSVNTAPTISSISAQAGTVNQATAPLPFTIGDAETAASSLTLSAVSSVTTLVPNANITFGGSGANRTVTVTPATGKTGSTQITISVSDGTNSANTSFSFTVQATATNTPPTISAISTQTSTVNQSIAAIPFTIGDAQTAASSLGLSAVSSVTSLIPNANIVFGGSGQNRTVTITPVADQTGSSQITITVNDGTNSANSSFTVTIQPAAANTPPTISAIANQAGYVSHAVGPIAFTVNDSTTPAASLAVSAVSSDQSLVPNASIALGGTGQNRTVTITPTPGQTGTANITVSVSDGIASAQSSFVLSISQPTAMPKSDLPATSTYNGLFYEDDAVRLQSAGSFKVTVTSAGKYSGTVQMATGKYSFSGQFGTFCEGTNVIVRKGRSPLVFNFSLNDAASLGQVSGTVSDGGWAAQMHGAVTRFNAATHPAPYSGSYTLAVPSSDLGVPLSLGNGFGSVRVDGSGNVKLSGVLADGTKVTQSAQISEDGVWPLFVPLYSGKGLLIAWISFTSRTFDDLHGDLNWIKQPDPAAHYYGGGFALQGAAVGSEYTPFSALALNATIARMQSSGSANGLITSIKVSTTTGTFKGSMLDRSTGKPMNFQGAMLQKPDAGYGFILGTVQSVPVLLTP